MQFSDVWFEISWWWKGLSMETKGIAEATQKFPTVIIPLIRRLRYARKYSKIFNITFRRSKKYSNSRDALKLWYNLL